MSRKGIIASLFRWDKQGLNQTKVSSVRGEERNSYPPVAEGNPCTVFDCAFNPEVIAAAKEEAQYVIAIG